MHISTAYCRYGEWECGSQNSAHQRSAAPPWNPATFFNTALIHLPLSAEYVVLELINSVDIKCQVLNVKKNSLAP